MEPPACCLPGPRARGAPKLSELPSLPQHVSAETSGARLLAVAVTMAAIGSEPLGRLAPFSAYLLLVGLAALHWRVPLTRTLASVWKISPVLLLIAAGLPASRMADRWMASWPADPGAPSPFLPQGDDVVLGTSLFLRAFCSFALLTVLVQSTGWPGLQRGLARLGLPAGVTMVLDQLERYRQLIGAEWRRTMLARESRSPGQRQFALASYSGQVGMVFLRSWERAARVHAAMLARGFSLDRPQPERPRTAPRGLAWWVPQPLWLPALAIALRLALSSAGTNLLP